MGRKCPYVNNYECDECMYCKVKPYKKGGLDNYNMLENIEITKISHKGIETIEGNNFIENFDNNFLGNDENGILGNERMFDNILDGGLMPTSKSITEDFNRIFGTNYKNIFKGDKNE